ncbi:MULTISPECIES: hypothetical protein [unclassified Microbacterium]|uniref:hypothetical protein n=1 Tax=unclassified Microbacterium TaxID=2609290 RepID=UPI0028832E4D|nr:MULTISPECIES: hypothetical protein [unclassified Microbacterium]
MDLQSILMVVVLAIATVTVLTWIINVWRRRNRRIGDSLTPEEIDRVIELRDRRYQSMQDDKDRLVIRAVAIVLVMAGALGIAWVSSQIPALLGGAPRSTDVAQAAIWWVGATILAGCVIAFLVLLLRPLYLLILITGADQKVTEEMRTAASKRRLAQAPRSRGRRLRRAR